MPLQRSLLLGDHSTTKQHKYVTYRSATTGWSCCSGFDEAKAVVVALEKKTFTCSDYLVVMTTYNQPLCSVL